MSENQPNTTNLPNGAMNPLKICFSPSTIWARSGYAPRYSGDNGHLWGCPPTTLAFNCRRKLSC